MNKGFLLLFMICFESGFAQTNSKDLSAVQAENSRINSLKRIVRKFENNLGSAEYDVKNEIAFIQSCASLGLYYENLFKTGFIPDMRQAGDLRIDFEKSISV